MNESFKLKKPKAVAAAAVAAAMMSTYVLYILVKKMTTREYVDEYVCSVHIGEDDDEGVR